MISGDKAFVEFTQTASDKLDLLDIEYDDRRIPELGNAQYMQFDSAIHQLPGSSSQQTEAIKVGSGSFILDDKKEHDVNENQDSHSNENSTSVEPEFLIGGKS